MSKRQTKHRPTKQQQAIASLLKFTGSIADAADRLHEQADMHRSVTRSFHSFLEALATTPPTPLPNSRRRAKRRRR